MATSQDTVDLSAKDGIAPNGFHHEYPYKGKSNDSSTVAEPARLPAFGGELQPGLHVPLRKFANPAPLGLSAFALTTFVLSLINVRTRGVSHPNLIVSLAYGYGGLLQLISGMWEMVVGNTFAATAMASYGGFWIALGIILTPGFEVTKSLSSPEYINSFGYFLIGWFIFTTILLLCTLRSTFALFITIFCLDMTFLFLAVGYLQPVNGAPRESLIKAGGWAGLATAAAAWYNALAGLLDRSNSFFILPVAQFPWSQQAQDERPKTAREMA